MSKTSETVHNIKIIKEVKLCFWLVEPDEDIQNVFTDVFLKLLLVF